MIVTWSNASSEIWAVASHDDGSTWGAPIKLQTSPTLETSFEHMMPALMSDGAGNLQTTYLTSGYSLVHALLGPL